MLRFRRKALSDSLFIEAALAATKCLDGNLVDKCVGRTIGRALVKLVIKGGHPCRHPQPVPARDSFLWANSKGVPHTCTVTTLQLSHLQKVVCCWMSTCFPSALEKETLCDVKNTWFNLFASSDLFLFLLPSLYVVENSCVWINLQRIKKTKDYRVTFY